MSDHDDIDPVERVLVAIAYGRDMFEEADMLVAEMVEESSYRQAARALGWSVPKVQRAVARHRARPHPSTHACGVPPRLAELRAHDARRQPA